jgi:hypothetical protein
MVPLMVSLSPGSSFSAMVVSADKLAGIPNAYQSHPSHRPPTTLSSLLDWATVSGDWQAAVIRRQLMATKWWFFIFYFEANTAYCQSIAKIGSIAFLLYRWH